MRCSPSALTTCKRFLWLGLLQACWSCFCWHVSDLQVLQLLVPALLLLKRYLSQPVCTGALQALVFRPRGDCILLLGPVGAGKTTLFLQVLD